MKISKLEYQRKDPNIVNIYVNEKFLAELNANDIIRLRLYSGQEITTDQLNEIIRESEFGKLFNAALNFLSFRPRTEWEIRRKLKSQIAKLKSPSQISNLEDQVIDKLKKIGQVNDEEFTKWYLDQRKEFRPMGKRGLKYELLRKGVAIDTINQLLSNPIKEKEGSCELEMAIKAIEKKRLAVRGKQLDKDQLFKEKARLQRFLASRGFSWETINLALSKILAKEYTYDE